MHSVYIWELDGYKIRGICVELSQSMGLKQKSLFSPDPVLNYSFSTWEIEPEKIQPEDVTVKISMWSLSVAF